MADHIPITLEKEKWEGEFSNLPQCDENGTDYIYFVKEIVNAVRLNTEPFSS